METSESIKEISGALAKSQAEFGKIAKDANNPFFKNQYATLASIISACLPALTSNGISVLQPVEPFHDSGAVVITTILLHSSGEWIRSKSEIKPTKTGPQDIGSAITYNRRYALASMLCVSAEEDDDGNRASEKVDKKEVVPAVVLSKKDELCKLLETMGLNGFSSARKEFIDGWVNKHEKDISEWSEAEAALVLAALKASKKDFKKDVK